MKRSCLQFAFPLAELGKMCYNGWEKEMRIMKKCEYCAREISYHEQYCSDDCQIAANKYYENSDRFAKLFMMVNVACVFGIPVGLFIMSVVKIVGAVIAGASCAVLGLMLLIFPFPTEGMNKKFGIKKAKLVTRIIGAACMVLGALIVLLEIRQYSCGVLTTFCHKSSALLHDIELLEIPFKNKSA